VARRGGAPAVRADQAAEAPASRRTEHEHSSLKTPPLRTHTRARARRRHAP
jgi:hypothetical protein